MLIQKTVKLTPTILIGKVRIYSGTEGSLSPFFSGQTGQNKKPTPSGMGFIIQLLKS